MPSTGSITSFLLVPLAVFGLLLLAVFLLQNRLLYYPTHEHPPAYVPSGLSLWPDPGVSIDDAASETTTAQTDNSANPVLGLIAQPDDGLVTRGTIIVFHGNAGHAGHRSYYAQQLSPLGFRTILAEYPGYGPRPDTPDESTLVDDAVKTVELAHATYGGPVWLIGESLGAGVAAAAAARTASLVGGTILVTPWNRLFDVASHHYPWLPLRWLLRSQYDSVQALASFNGPKLIIVASNDTIIPAHLGRDLYQRLPQPKKLLELTDAGHNTWTGYASPSLWPEAMQWLVANADTPEG